MGMSNAAPLTTGTVLPLLTVIVLGLNLQQCQASVIVNERLGPYYDFEQDIYTVIEGADPTAVVYVIRTRSGLDHGPVLIDVVSSDGTALNGTDFTAINDTLNFQSTNNRVAVNVSIMDNDIENLDTEIHCFTLTLMDPNPFGSVGSATKVCIIDDDNNFGGTCPPPEAVIESNEEAVIVTTVSSDRATAVVTWTNPTFRTSSMLRLYKCFLTAMQTDVECNNGDAFPITYTYNEYNRRVLVRYTVVTRFLPPVQYHCNFYLRVLDSTQPVINCPDEVVARAGEGSMNGTADWEEPVGTDNSGEVTTTSSLTEPLPLVLDIGTYTYTYTAVDSSGNDASCSFNVTITDNIPPVFVANTCPSSMSQVADPGAMTTTVTWPNPTATDSSGIPIIECTPSSGSLFTIGSENVTCAATDSTGHSAYCIFSVSVTASPDPTRLSAPVVPVDGIITQNSFMVSVTPADRSIGNISCYDIVVKEMLDGEDITMDPDRDYPPETMASYEESQNTPGKPYVAVVKGETSFDAPETVEIGSGSVSICQGGVSTSRMKRQATYSHTGGNGPLKAGTLYTAFLRAYVTATNREVYLSSPLMKPVQTGDGTTVTIIGAAGGLCVLLIIIVLIVCIVRRRMRRWTDNTKTAKTDIEMVETGLETAEERDIASPIYEDVTLPQWALKWQIAWNDLFLDEFILGRGNFGEVRAGTVKRDGKVTKSAIKILKDSMREPANEDFMREFETLTKIGYHPNVVALLGACQHEEILYVAMEFLPNGDLRTYMRRARLQSETEEGALSSDQLLKIALDVAKGMKHLGELEVIHRDLAARNILLETGLTAKVSDFGLSRGEDVYVQTSLRRVPTRWLAIESLTCRSYTTQSDVWSFGILLWEIATLGATPYPGIMAMSLAEKLEAGYRMPQPNNCHDEIYALMMQCWSEDPKWRPTFTDLVSTLKKMANSPTKQKAYMVVDQAYYERFIIQPQFDDN